MKDRQQQKIQDEVVTAIITERASYMSPHNSVKLSVHTFTNAEGVVTTYIDVIHSLYRVCNEAFAIPASEEF